VSPIAVCFAGILYRLVTGAAWTTIEAIMDYRVSDTTLRARRDEWIEAGVFDEIARQARAGYQRLIGLRLDHVSIDGSDQQRGRCSLAISYPRVWCMMRG
jgi:hypothetical protein